MFAAAGNDTTRRTNSPVEQNQLLLFAPLLQSNAALRVRETCESTRPHLPLHPSNARRYTCNHGRLPTPPAASPRRKTHLQSAPSLRATHASPPRQRPRPRPRPRRRARYVSRQGLLRLIAHPRRLGTTCTCLTAPGTAGLAV